jgi:membrane-bound lytic murein transglycosylase MltF
MGIEWIDEIAVQCATIEDAKGRHVRAYHVFDKAEFPATLTEFPCALSYIDSVSCVYRADVQYDLFEGHTEFHLVENTDRSKYPYVASYFEKIRNAFAAHITLNGKVTWCLLKNENGDMSLQAAILQYGNEVPHFGIVAYWQVEAMSSVTAGV